MNVAQGTNQGELVLDNNAPHVNADTVCHGPRAPKRNTNARAATAIASSASATAEPAGRIGVSAGSNAWAHTVKCTLIGSAQPAKRRSQPRTVDACTPSATAIAR